MLHSDLEALVGATIHGRYEVDTLLGVGGMGAVFKGRHTGLQRGVAIKVLHPEIGRDPSVSKRFDREAQSASRLDHPNCVRVTDFGTTENGTKYLVMELLEGGDLDGRLGQPWAPERAIATIEQVLRGLEHAHHVGIVHRDLKPENIFVTRDFRGDEVIKIVDFGIAKLIDEQGSEKLTRQGIVFGTPRYMAPEQAAGGKVDERTDLYAVGLIFYELLAGHPPFESDEAAQLLRMQIMAPPPPLPPSVPGPLVKIVEKLIEKSKTDRYASAREVLDALEHAKGLLVAVAAQPSTIPIAVVAPAAAAPTQPIPPSSSGAAWQPAPEPIPAVSGATLAASAVELAAMSASSMSAGAAAYSTSPTASHPSLASHPSTSVAGVAMQPTAPQRRRVLPFVLAGVTLVLLLAGVGVLMSSMDEPEEPSASEQAEPREQPAAVAAGEPVTSAAPSSEAEAKPERAGPNPAPSNEISTPPSRPVRPAAQPDAKPKSKPDPKQDDGTDNKTVPSKDEDQTGGGSDSATKPKDSTTDTTDPTDGPSGGPVDPSKPDTKPDTNPDTKPDSSEADAEQREREEKQHNGSKHDGEKDREQGRGKDKGKGHDKKKDD